MGLGRCRMLVTFSVVTSLSLPRLILLETYRLLEQGLCGPFSVAHSPSLRLAFMAGHGDTIDRERPTLITGVETKVGFRSLTWDLFSLFCDFA